MPSIQDWAAKAARHIIDEPRPGLSARQQEAYESRLAAIIATFAAPLMDTLRASRREHHHCEDSWYCCNRCDSPDHGGGELRDGACTCGADAWNARVDAVLAGEPHGA